MKSISKSTVTAILTALVALAVPAMAQSQRVPISIEYSGSDQGVLMVHA